MRRGAWVVFTPVLAFCFAAFVFLGPIAFSFAFLPNVLALAATWWLTSAILQLVSVVVQRLKRVAEPKGD